MTRRRVILSLVAVVAVVAVVVVVVLLRGGSVTPPEPPELRTTGPWVDVILISEETSAAVAVMKLEAGDIDIWWMLPIIDRDLFERISEHPDMQYDFSYGSYTDLLFNVAGP